MQITIDTKHDSPEDIKNIIRLLQALVGESQSSNIFSSSGETPQGLFNIFSQPEEEKKREREKTISIIEY